MPYLTITSSTAPSGGATVDVAVGSVSITYNEIGDQGSTFDGTYRSTVRARKKVWSLATPPQTRATADNVYSYLTGTSVVASGDLVNVSGGVSVFVTGITQTVSVGPMGGEYVSTGWTMREA